MKPTSLFLSQGAPALVLPLVVGAATAQKLRGTKQRRNPTPHLLSAVVVTSGGRPVEKDDADC